MNINLNLSQDYSGPGALDFICFTKILKICSLVHVGALFQEHHCSGIFSLEYAHLNNGNGNVCFKRQKAVSAVTRHCASVCCIDNIIDIFRERRDSVSFDQSLRLARGVLQQRRTFIQLPIKVPTKFRSFNSPLGFEIFDHKIISDCEQMVQFSYSLPECHIIIPTACLRMFSGIKYEDEN